VRKCRAEAFRKDRRKLQTRPELSGEAGKDMFFPCIFFHPSYPHDVETKKYPDASIITMEVIFYTEVIFTENARDITMEVKLMHEQRYGRKGEQISRAHASCCREAHVDRVWCPSGFTSFPHMIGRPCRAPCESETTHAGRLARRLARVQILDHMKMRTVQSILKLSLQNVGVPNQGERTK
jgi:hypothetical protein